MTAMPASRPVLRPVVAAGSLLLLGLLWTAGVALAQLAVPALHARVTDLTGTLDVAQTAALEQKLAAFEARKGAQIAVLLVPTTRPETIEQYGIRVAEAWKLGRKGVDDGVLLLVARDDRELRIDVGYGLEGALPDATTHRIIDEVITPSFRTGDFYGGIDAGVTRILAVIDGEPLPEVQAGRQQPGGFDALLQFLPILFFFTVMFGTALKRLLGQLPGALATGLMAGGIAWLFIGAAAFALLAALLAFFLTLLSRAAPGGWVSPGRGGLPGGGGFGGGRGGGSFGGGGGSFGGGGSSGRW